MADQNIPVTANGSVQINCDNNSNSDDQSIVFSHEESLQELMRIQENGKVGIGTATPVYKLDVTDSSNAAQAIFGKGRNTNESQILIGGGQTDDKLLLIGMDPSGGYAYLHTYGTTKGQGLVLKRSGETDGNVGIGTTSPESKLHVAGSITAAEDGVTSGIKTTMTLTTSPLCEGLYAVSIDPVFSDPYNRDSIGCLKIEPSGSMIDYGIRVVMPYGVADNSNRGIKVEQPDLEEEDPQYGVYAATGIYANVGLGGKGRAISGEAYSNQGAIGGYFEAQSGSIALKAKGVSIVHGYLKIGVVDSPDATPTEAIDVNGNIKCGDGAWNGGHFIMGNYHLWVDTSGRLRIKNGVPTSATDGTVVGTQS